MNPKRLMLRGVAALSVLAALASPAAAQQPVLQPGEVLTYFFSADDDPTAEHGIIDILEPAVTFDVGDTVEIWPHYSDATISLHERMYGVRDGRVEEIFELLG